MGKKKIKTNSTTNSITNRSIGSSDVAIKLPKVYEPELLQRDLNAIEHIQRISQPGPYHNGEWAGVSLYSSGGITNKAAPGPGFEPFQETDILKQTPYFKSVLDDLQCPKLAVRLLWLPPGGKIGQHSDGIIGFNAGFLRLHIPVITHSDVIFLIANQRCHWQAGELWYGNFAQVHSVENRSPINRVHIVLDVEINDFVLSLFPPDFIKRKKNDAITMPKPPMVMSEEELKRYQCKFKFPRDKRPITTGKVQEMDDIEIALVNNRLAFVVNGKPELSLQPITKTNFAFVGTPSLAVEFKFSNDRVNQLSFLFRRGSKKEDYTIRVSVYC